MDAIDEMDMPIPLPTTTRALEDGIAAGLNTGAQLYVSRGGEVVADVGIGLAAPGVPMTPATITLWMSAVKPVTAVAIALLWERGRLELDDPIARHVPEFAQNGKGGITLRHALTHTGGFRLVAGVTNTSVEAWDVILARICAARPEPRWEPGRKAGYHVATSWFLLAEIVRRLSGRAFDRFVREEVYEPLGMADSWIGMPAERAGAYAAEGRIAVYYDTSKGPPDIATPPPDAAALGLVRPGGNGRGPIRELGRFYEMLLGRGRGVLRPQTVEAITARHRVGLPDHSFGGALIDWGLGVMLNSSHYYEGRPDWPYNFGPHAGPRTFGHSGAQSGCAFCDPDRELVVAWTCNGFPGEERHQVRQRAINMAIYTDLALSA